ncbi:MAG: NAD(P)-binding domain-containing protein, partial [Streptosporangiaceae bacterium]
MSDAVDVAIVGAGPYGLSLAAHLRGTGVSFRQFGLPMDLWRTMMPAGMYLKSQGFASNIADPAGTHTLAAFCAATGRPYASYGLPVALDDFVGYGDWFRAELVPGVEEVLVTGIARRRGGFDLTLADGGQARAAKVVVAAGVEHFAYVPEPLSQLPDWACTHSSAHDDMAAFCGQDVVVIGAGQSALESAALLHENGAAAQVVAREPVVAWNGKPLDQHRPLLQRMREPESGLGSGYATWFYTQHPGRAREVAGTPAALGAEIAKQVEAGPQPRVAPTEVFERYGIRSVVSQIDDLYEQLLAGRPRRVRRRAAARRPSSA